ncbi:unnamed protein product [marine sediment metagenome]|uniref:AB hydrolase-1 domain-containing protein n=1 Tax=marine sediment metagenome TaxID=412755 RepID=X1AXY6_9ZZZZ
MIKKIAKDKQSTKWIIETLKADNIDHVKNSIARTYRRFVESRENDLLALAAVQAGWLEYWYKIITTPAQMKGTLKKIKVPLMTVVGSADMLPGNKTLMAQLVPDACHFQIQGKNHFSVIPDPKFHMAVKAFLDFVNNQ